MGKPTTAELLEVLDRDINSAALLQIEWANTGKADYWASEHAKYQAIRAVVEQHDGLVEALLHLLHVSVEVADGATKRNSAREQEAHDIARAALAATEAE